MLSLLKQSKTWVTSEIEEWRDMKCKEELSPTEGTARFSAMICSRREIENRRHNRMMMKISMAKTLVP